MIVVTGGAGFIGSNVVAALDEGGVAVAVCDWLGSGDKWRNLAKRALADWIEPERLFDWLHAHRGRVDAIVHMGAVSATTEADVDLILRSNFTLTMRLWQWCAAARVRLLYASSAATYGGGEAGFDDDGTPAALARLQPLNPYGWSKHLVDRRVAALLARGAPRPPQWAGLKFFNVYGPNEYHKGAQQSVVPAIFAAARAGHPARLFRSHREGVPDGGQRRDFVWVGDAVAVVLWLLQRPQVSGLFNVGTGRAGSFKELAEAVFAALGREPMIAYIATPEALRERYQYFTEAKVARLRAAGFDAPFTPLADGARRYVQDHLNAGDPYR